MRYSPLHKSAPVSHIEHGLTLVEMLVVAPLIILIIGTMIGFMTSITGDGLIRAETNSTIYNVQAALDGIEKDVLSADTFLSTTGALSSPQGSNGGTAAFANPGSGTTSTVLILKTPALKGNQLTNSRDILRQKDAPHWCGTTYEYLNPYLPVTIVYFLNGTSLWKRTIVDTGASGTTCDFDERSQKSSCTSTAVNPTLCEVIDEQLLDTASGLTVTFYASPITTSPALNVSNVSTATTVTVKLDSSSQIAGRTITYSGAIKATK